MALALLSLLTSSESRVYLDMVSTSPFLVFTSLPQRRSRWYPSYRKRHAAKTTTKTMMATTCCHFHGE